MEHIDRYFAGLAIWGDDFDEEQRKQWFRDEEDAYVELYASNPTYEYEYEQVNTYHGFRFLPADGRFRRVLGLGSAYGDELRPVLDRVDSVVIVESSDHYHERDFEHRAFEWRRAAPSGELPLENGEVDLAVCFGVLHHIPNVSHVLSELGRVVEPGGYALVREPIISMGDWRTSRPGLTPRERGIPRDLLSDAAQAAGFEIVRERLCFFPGTRVLARLLRRDDPYSDALMVRLDAVCSVATQFNYRYHATSMLQKVRPTSSFLTLRRSEGS